MYDKVLELFGKGEAPSKIDDALKLEKGTAHDIIVFEWTQRKVFSVCSRAVRRG